MFVDQIAAAIAGAHPRALDEISKSVWKGLGEGALTDDDAQRLAEIIHARREALKAVDVPTRHHQRPASLFPVRKPQRPALRATAIERRRRLATSGPLPPSVACKFTVGELAVMRIVGDECREKGACLLPLGAIAARAGVCRKLAQNAIRLATRLGLLSYEERRRPGRPNLTNVVKVACKEWRAWLARGPKGERGGGKKLAPTDTRVGFQKKEREGRSAHNREGQRSGGGKEGRRAMR